MLKREPLTPEPVLVQAVAVLALGATAGQLLSLGLCFMQLAHARVFCADKAAWEGWVLSTLETWMEEEK